MLHVADCPRTNSPPDDPCVCEHWPDVPRDCPEGARPDPAVRHYTVDMGLLAPSVHLAIPGIPPCLYCGVPVTRPSMGGPLVCACCDMGVNEDGTRTTDAQYVERHAHRRQMIETYRVRSTPAAPATSSPSP